MPHAAAIKERNIALYHKMEALRLAADYAGLSAFLTDDAEVSFPFHIQTVAWAGKRTGAESIVATARLIDADVEILSRETLFAMNEGDTLVVRFFMQIASRASSGQAAFEGIDYVRFRDGKLAVFIEYFDTDAVLAMLRGD